MSGKQSAVLWLGLLLIAAQFYFGGQFQALFGLVKSTPTTGKKSASGGLKIGTPGNNNPPLGPKGKNPL